MALTSSVMTRSPASALEVRLRPGGAPFGRVAAMVPPGGVFIVVLIVGLRLVALVALLRAEALRYKLLIPSELPER